MTEKEKALELVMKYYNLKKRPLISFWKDIRHAKQCALIAVDEILYYQSVVLEAFPSDGYEPQYWKIVKEEILKLTDFEK